MVETQRSMPMARVLRGFGVETHVCSEADMVTGCLGGSSV